MSEDTMLKLLICFVLGYLAYRMMGDGFSVGVLPGLSGGLGQCCDYGDDLIGHCNDPNVVCNNIRGWGKLACVVGGCVWDKRPAAVSKCKGTPVNECNENTCKNNKEVFVPTFRGQGNQCDAGYGGTCVANERPCEDSNTKHQ